MLKRSTKYLYRNMLKYVGIRKKFCCICNKAVVGFLPYEGEFKNFSFTELKIVGSDVRNFMCPHCRCIDRERHLFLYAKKLDLISKMSNAKILHFAPEKNISKIINEIKPSKYIKADLYPTSPDIQKIDMLSIPFEDNTFDFVIANHVLEHVSDVSIALKELNRILKIGGLGVLQTPYSSVLQNTFSDPGISSDSARLNLYGQEDHVRVFGNDIFQIITSNGFKSRVCTHHEILYDIDPIQYGVNVLEPLFLFEKI
ncbi:class I SAM-dependent methyltransferase [Acetivibrio cellulolyticus]|uniref:class I SAM-dependent methyltransferase n=1 Tax=Acetivibrio cellulolyticus TaxID=35830 RepID=UPI0001E2EC11|nr:class I SAM-dependent methyltransferase [Acetivibrio cellulolyticus]